MSLKNSSDRLVSIFRGVVDNVPQRWRAKLGITQIKQKNPLDVGLTELGEGLVASQVVQEQTNERQKTDVFIENPVGQTMVEYIRTKDGQVGTRILKYVEEGTRLPTFDELTIDAGQEASGNGWAEQMVVTVPNLFGANDYSVELRDVIPPEFAALLKTFETSETVAGVAVMPTLGLGDLRREEQQVTEQTKRVSRRYRDILDLPQVIVDKDTNKEKQVVTITKTLELDTVTPLLPTAIKDTKFEKLGNGLAVQTEIAVDAIFVGAVYGTSIINLIPERFRGDVPTRKHDYTVTGAVVVEPPLTTGQLSKTESQSDEFNKRVEIVYIDPTVVPITFVSKETNKEKQVVTITDILEVDSTTPLLPTAIRDTKFLPLGNGLAIQTIESIDAIFVGAVYEKSILNLIPERMRADVPQRKHDFTVTGAVSTDPPLATGDLSRTETQIDEFNKRIQIASIDDSEIPKTVVDKGLTREFGGSETNIFMTLDVQGTQVVETGLRVIDSKIERLGNGYEVLTTIRAIDTTWTALEGQDYDERFNVVIPYTQQVKTPGANIGDTLTEIKPLDKWKQQNRTIDIDAVITYLDTYSLRYFGKVNVDMPDKLVGISSVIAQDSGEGASEETGDVAFTGNYSISMGLRATAQSSATILPDVAPEIKQFWGNNIKALELHFFLPSPADEATVLAKINDLLGDTVAEWPKFNPVMVTLTIRGGRISVQATASSQGSAAVNDSGSSSTTGGGTGYSRETGLTLKTTRISPTIHAEIAVSGETSDDVTVSATAEAEAVGLGPFESESQDGTTSASVTPSTVPATDGDVDWPTTGMYLYRVDAQPYRFGYIQFHCVIVNAADFPNS